MSQVSSLRRRKGCKKRFCRRLLEGVRKDLEGLTDRIRYMRRTCRSHLTVNLLVLFTYGMVEGAIVS